MAQINGSDSIMEAVTSTESTDANRLMSGSVVELAC